MILHYVYFSAGIFAFLVYKILTKHGTTYTAYGYRRAFFKAFVRAVLWPLYFGVNIKTAWGNARAIHHQIKNNNAG